MNYISLALGSAILLYIVYFWSMRMREITDSWRWVPVLDPNKDTSLPKSPPRISVIVPANNEEALIGTSLRSILDQDYPNLEIICVDDRSTDRTAEIVGKLPGRADRWKRRCRRSRHEDLLCILWNSIFVS